MSAHHINAGRPRSRETYNGGGENHWQKMAKFLKFSDVKHDCYIKFDTLRRYLKKLHNSAGVSKSPLRRLTFLRPDQGEVLGEFISDMENRMYGLNLVDVSPVIVQYCELDNIKNPSKLTKMASLDWMTAFLDRNSDIALRTPEADSIQSAIGFNRVKVAGICDCLSSIIFSDNTRFIPPSQIYNVDEYGYTICHKPTKVLTKKARKVFLPLSVLNRANG
ncbi:hypothetical protein LSH36_745g00018 [Paralvinella palmiformis]|uniref:HTH CENPB-type domain-containing protein n=1 Tax=Paralvinella palmiformis TaxID=53620 RepID=A0AAD9J2R7_9ANNE|nr:hypothetical protein LSH36_745g00018 [Paralvinella palmiformis]